MHKYDSSISHNNFIKIATLGYTLSLHTRYRDISQGGQRQLRLA